MNFLKNIRILYRHLIVTVITVVMFIAVAIISNKGINNVRKDLDKYAMWSNIDMVMNENVIQKALSLINAVRTYKDIPSEKNYTELQKYLLIAKKDLQDWLKMLNNLPKIQTKAKALQPQFAKVVTIIDSYRKIQDKHSQIMKHSDQMLVTVVDELERVMIEIIDPAKEKAENQADIPEMIRWGKIDMVMNEGVIANALKFMTTVHDYAYESDKNKLTAAKKALANARKGLEEWSQTLRGETVLQKTADMVGQAYDTLQSNLDSLTELNQKVTTLDESLNYIISWVEQTTKSIMVKQIDPAKKRALTEASNIQTEISKKIIIISIIAVIIILFLLVSIALFESGILKRLTALANAISTGDFKHEFNLSQKDELGEIARAFNKIKNSITDLSVECDKLAGEIEKGKLDARIQENQFEGGYAEMVGNINSMLAVSVNLIDKLPIGAMIRSAERDILYLNEAGTTLVGTNKIAGKKCNELFNTEDCQKKCASDLCLETARIESSETTARPVSGEYEISYSALPLHSRSGEVLGVLEVVIDQTAIRSAQKIMLQVAGQAGDISNRVASASEELAAQVEQVSKGSEIQQQRIEETATAMEEMNATVLEVAQNASEATKQSDSAKSKADQGAELVDKVIQAINQVNVIARNLQDNMGELGHKAEEIGSVMTMITDIADQTNLLALNAAIEAARAGEAGRGFAVVADEVRKLAEKTMSATNEVGNSIKAIQDATKNNAHSVDNAAESVALATELANESGKALEEIVTLSSESSALITSIATAAEQQSATSEEINQAIEDVNRVTSETTDGMVQSARAIQELAQMAVELRTMLGRLSAIED